MQKGKVYIAGAGPGDEKLVTLKCKELIMSADVIIYDRLVSKKLLYYVKKDCELIYAGKEASNHILKQFEINNIMVEKAKQNKVVLRLKGGDPFIFGRGGEEAEVLYKEDIEFEIVPGVSSFYSVCAYAGIPITHRDYSSSIHIFTGHKKDNNDIDYKKISKLRGTLIFLMSIKNLENIINNLIKEGLNKNLPVAVIQWGTTSKQKVIIGNLFDIFFKVKEENINNVSVVVIGDVVNARAKLDWTIYKPLWKKKILVTRKFDEIEEFEKILYEKGAFVVPFPTIEINNLECFDELDTAINNISSYNCILFTSVNSVKSFFDRMKNLNKDIRLLFNIKIFAIGEKTKAAIEDKGIFIDFIPLKYNSREIIELLKNNISKKENILYPTSDIVDNSLVNGIKCLGININKVKAYSNKINTIIDNDVFDEIINGEFDAIAFASSSQAKNFMNMTNRKFGNSKICSIGLKTTQTLKDLGINVDITSEISTMEGLANSVLKVLL